MQKGIEKGTGEVVGNAEGQRMKKRQNLTSAFGNLKNNVLEVLM